MEREVKLEAKTGSGEAETIEVGRRRVAEFKGRGGRTDTGGVVGELARLVLQTQMRNSRLALECAGIA
jgi:hypothetical protein